MDEPLNVPPSSEAANDETMLPDHDQRRVIEEDLDSNVVVVASAGTGKTESLIRRMVAGVVAGKLEVESLVAITFTRMAAGEMRARFAERLRDAAETSEKAREALRKIDRAFVGTIHAFCARMLRERPLEAGLRPDFTEVDEHDVTILWRHFWRDELQRLYADGDLRVDGLAAVGVDVRDLYDFFVTRSENSDLKLSSGRLEPPDLSHTLDRVEEILDRVRMLLGGSIPEERDTFLDQLDLADHIRRHRGVDGASDQADLLRVYRRGIKGITQRRWPDPSLAKKVKNEIIGALAEEVIDPALTEWRQYVYGMVAPLIDDLVARFALHRRQNGLVTFHDLLVLTSTLLRDSQDVREFFQRKYRVFFVDEFQDTDPLQAEIISYLVGSDTSEQDWRALTPLPGRLFIVGDEKQSVYRFRRADIDVFRLVRDRVVESGGRLVKLHASFRSEPALCEWINAAFAPLFDAQDSRYQAAYDELQAARPTGDPRLPVLRLTTEKVTRNDEDSIVGSEAARVADYIEGEVAGSGDGIGRSPGDFMVLTRRRKHLGRYAAALEGRGIPYDIVGGDSLGTAEELISLVNMLEAIRRPADEVAMLAYLRGPLVGLGDDELYTFRKAGGRFRSDADVPGDMPEGVADRVGAAFDSLAHARQDLVGLPVSTAFERIMDRLGLMAFAAGEESGSTRVGSLLRTLSLVEKWESDGLTWSEIVAELGAVIGDRYYQYEQMTLDVGREDVVRIMNLHQAKGLEADVVILADAYESRSHSITEHVSRTGEEETLSMVVTVSKTGAYGEAIAEPLGWQEAMEAEKLFEDAEDLRVTYVAATRARRQLVVCRYPSSEKGPWSRLYRRLESVPELEAHPLVGAKAAARMMSDPDERFAQAVARLKERAQPTYSLHSVTGDDPSILAEDIPLSGRGADYGTLMHRVFESAINGTLPDNPEDYVSAMAASMELSSYSTQILKELALFRASDLWRELIESREVYSEVPFAHPIADEPGGVMRGTIDLIMRTKAGWKIVDFKTHHTESDQAIEALMERYRNQLRSYAHAWTLVTGDPVAEAGLWLTERGRFVSLPV